MASAPSAVSSDAMVTVEGLSWTPDGQDRPTLVGIDLAIHPRERILLAGPSGCGKSTLLRALADVLHVGVEGQLTGRILRRGQGTDGARADGAPGTEAAPALSVGLLLQDPRTARVAETVGRDVAFGCENLGMPVPQIATAVDEALRAVGFPYGPTHRTDALSGGQSQRLALAGVLAPRPDLLLLDEPTSMLDPRAAAEVREAVISALKGTEIALVVVEHRLDGWLPHLHRLLVLSDEGHLVADGPLRETLSQHADSLVRKGIWVPGYPDPEPLAVEPQLVASSSPLSAPAPPSAPSGGTARSPSPAGSEASRPSATADRGGDLVLCARDVGLVYARPLFFVGARRKAPQPTEALRGVDLALRAGRLHLLRGTSGAGKSSLVSILTGLAEPTTGSVHATPLLAGDLPPAPVRWRSPDLARRIGWVPQEAAATVVGATVWDCLLATTRALGLPTAEAEARAAGLADALGLRELLDRSPYRLSGGEARRLAVAAGLVHGPGVLCLDEPTVGQDRRTWAAVTGLLRAAADAGVAVLVSTHDAALGHHADEETWLVAGQIGPADEPGGQS